MFDIGWSELLVVLVIALVVVGPKDLPRLMRTVGRWVAKARGMADQFRSSFDEMARETELDELRKEIQALRSGNPLASVTRDLNRTADDVNRSILPPETPPAEELPAPEGAAEPAADDVAPEADDEAAIDIHAEPAEEIHENHKTPLLPDSEPPAS